MFTEIVLLLMLVLNTDAGETTAEEQEVAQDKLTGPIQNDVFREFMTKFRGNI